MDMLKRTMEAITRGRYDGVPLSDLLGDLLTALRGARPCINAVRVHHEMESTGEMVPERPPGKGYVSVGNHGHRRDTLRLELSIDFDWRS